MNFKLLQYKENASASFWLLPAVAAVLAIILSFVTLYLDSFLSQIWVKATNILYLVGPDGAHAVLSTIAAASVTILSITFSITILTLSFASTQLGPRLIPTFMKQGITQFVLAIFIATFIYCLLVLRAVQPDVAVPYISFIICLMLGIVCFFLFIYFIHYICSIIQIDNILLLLTKELTASIDRCFLSDKKNDSLNEKISEQKKTTQYTSIAHGSCEITLDEAGYIQTIDYDKLFKLAKENDLLLNSLHQPGKYIFNKLPVIVVLNQSSLNNKLKNKIKGCFGIGFRRMPIQDVEFAFEQLVEIAVRALSPGVNNPYTAISCLNCIGQGLIILTEKHLPSKMRYDEKRNPRLITNNTNHHQIVCSAFSQIRHYAQQATLVNFRMLEMIEELLRSVSMLSFQQALYKEAKSIMESCENNKAMVQEDLNLIKDKYNLVTELVQGYANAK